MVQSSRIASVFVIISLVLSLASCGSAGAKGMPFTQQTTATPAVAGPAQPPSTPPPQQPPITPPPAQFSCPNGTEDMVSWMMPSDMSAHTEGNNDYKSFYLKPGKMYFIKNRRGWPLDEKLYDNNYIYDYITENGKDGWFNAANVKEFAIPPKLAPRCIPVGAPGQKLATVTNANTPFVSKMSCQIVSRHQLGGIIGQVWNMGLHDFGLLDQNGHQIGPVDTRVLTYRWGCDPTFSTCQTREELWLARGYGWVEWKNYVWKNGQFVLVNDTKGTHLTGGAPLPDQPCGDAPVQ